MLVFLRSSLAVFSCMISCLRNVYMLINKTLYRGVSVS